MTTTSRQMQASESWTRTKSVKYHLKHTWSIEDFSFKVNKKIKHDEEKYFLQSVPFSPPDNDKLQFRIRLYPHGDKEENQDSVGVFLNLIKSEEKEVQVKFSMAILKTNGKVFRINSCNYTFTELAGWGFPDFINRKELLSKASEALPGDILTIQCKMYVIYDQVVESAEVISERLQQLTLECTKKQSEDWSSLLSTREHSDVILKVKGKELKAHKLVLSTRSSVFKAMFKNDFKEGNEGKVEITDVNLGAFKEFLRFLYTGMVTIDENAFDLLEIADKYATETLKSLCEEYLSLKLALDTVVPILVKADMHSAEELKVKAIQFILNNINTLVEIKNWNAALEKRPKLCLEVVCQIAKASKPLNNSV